LVSIDFFTVPTARLRVLFVLVLLAHHRRRVVHFNVTEPPAAHWTAQQIVNAFPDESAPRYLLRDRDKIYGQPFRHRVKSMGTEEVLTAPHSPWQKQSPGHPSSLPPCRCGNDGDGRRPSATRSAGPAAQLRDLFGQQHLHERLVGHIAILRQHLQLLE
jgi:hypothetical protein